MPTSLRSGARRTAAGLLAVAVLSLSFAYYFRGSGEVAFLAPSDDLRPALAASTTAFVDVAPGSYYADAVEWAIDEGITNGVNDSNRFVPNRPVTRAEAVTFLWRAAGKPAAGRAPMWDVVRGSYYAPAVDWAVEQGISTGVTANRFEPGRSITRAEAVTLMWRYAGSPGAQAASFNDISGYGWAANAIAWAEQQYVSTGTSDGRFHPGGTATRAQSVTMLWRAVESPARPSPGGSSGPAPSSPGGASKPATPSTPSTTTTTTPEERSTSGFVHPGVVIDKAQLDYVKINIAAGREPWKAALNELSSSGGSTKTSARPTSYRYSSLSYVPAPVKVIQAPSGSNKDWIDANPQYGFAAVGDVEHLDDARAAYAQALLWYYTGDTRYAAKAIEIMNAWSSTLTEIAFDQPRRPDNGVQLYNNGKLQAGWGASLFARAAEIIRYTGGGWSAPDVARFEKMLKDVYLPLVITGWSNGANWLMTFAEATMGIGVFTNDRATFDAGVAMWRQKAPTTIYLPSDGAMPIAPDPNYDTEAKMRALWYGPSSYVSGLQAETLRDISHMAMGLGALANGAETARIQGVDLFGEQQNRIVAGFERSAGYVNDYLDKVASLGGSQPPSTWVPSGWVGSTFKTGGDAYTSGWQVAYTHYASRSGVSMPQTARLVQRLGPSGPALHLSWDTLTHAR